MGREPCPLDRAPRSPAGAGGEYWSLVHYRTPCPAGPKLIEGVSRGCDGPVSRFSAANLRRGRPRASFAINPSGKSHILATTQWDLSLDRPVDHGRGPRW